MSCSCKTTTCSDKILCDVGTDGCATLSTKPFCVGKPDCCEWSDSCQIPPDCKEFLQ